jgi:hypothetical protein
MKLYHGSNYDSVTVDLSQSKDKRDFGKGFYLTTFQYQAKDWAEILFTGKNKDNSSSFRDSMKTYCFEYYLRSFLK